MSGMFGMSGRVMVEAAGVLGAFGYAVCALAARRGKRAVRRRGAALLALELPERRGRGWSGVRAHAWLVPLGVVLVGWALVGGPLGWVAGLAGAYGVRRRQRTRGARTPGPDAEEQAEMRRRLPLAADLLAACVSAGAGPWEAAQAVGESLGGPVGTRLVRTAAEIRLGGDPSVAWARFGEIPGADALARCLDRAGTTGAPAAEPVARLAEAMRAERASVAVARAQRAGVLITAPVGLCFLPAFLAIGVAPVVIGLAAGLLRST